MSTRKLRRKYRPVSREKLVSGKSRIIKRTLAYRRQIDHEKKWFVVRTNIGCGRRAEIGLKERGFDVFRPVEDRWRVYKHRCSDVSMGWFGRYVFVGFEAASRFDKLREANGVESILGVVGEPIAVRPEVLQRIADEIAGYRKAPLAPFKEGQDVLIAAGPFAELHGIVEEADEQTGRASVAVEMFGKTHVQELDFVELKAA